MLPTSKIAWKCAFSMEYAVYTMHYNLWAKLSLSLPISSPYCRWQSWMSECAQAEFNLILTEEVHISQFCAWNSNYLHLVSCLIRWKSCHRSKVNQRALFFHSLTIEHYMWHPFWLNFATFYAAKRFKWATDVYLKTHTISMAVHWDESQHTANRNDAHRIK